MGLVCCVLEVVLTFYVLPVDQGLVYFAKLEKRNAVVCEMKIGNVDLRVFPQKKMAKP